MNQYPKSPLLDNYDFIKPSHEFKKSIRRVILAIIIFFIFYMLLIAGASIVLWFTIWAVIGILKVRLSFISLAAGAGIISLGVMFFVFLFKFIFFKNKEFLTLPYLFIVFLNSMQKNKYFYNRCTFHLSYSFLLNHITDEKYYISLLNNNTIYLMP